MEQLGQKSSYHSTNYSIFKNILLGNYNYLYHDQLSYCI
jgi:hypothetical protein